MKEWHKRLEQLLADRQRGSLQLLRMFVRLCRQMAAARVPAEYIRESLARLVSAHPAMALFWQLAYRLDTLESQTPLSADTIAAVASDFLDQVLQNSEQAAQILASSVPGGATVLTHSASSQVRLFLQECRRLGKEIHLLCTLSEPGGEGTLLASWAYSLGFPVLLLAEAQVGTFLPEITLFLIGSDALCLDGVIHKVGTALLAYSAWLEHRPVWVLSCREKILPRSWSGELAGVAPPLRRRLSLPQATPLYDCTSWDYISIVATEQGLERAATFREYLLAFSEQPQT